MSTTPTARSLDYCKRQGWTAGVVERWIGYGQQDGEAATDRKGRPGVRVDFLGCIDLIVLPSGGKTIVIGPDCEGVVNGILGVQCCAGSGHAAHVTKAKAEPRLRDWLQAGGRYEVWSWRKAAKRVNGRLWQLRREAITLADLPEQPSGPFPPRE